MSDFVLRDRGAIHADLVERVENPVIKRLIATVAEDEQSDSPGSSFLDFPDFIEQ